MNDPSCPTQEDLIRLAAAGDQSAFGMLYDQTVDEVAVTVHFLLGDKQARDDVLQEIFLEVYRSLPRFEIGRPFRPWITGIAIRQINNHRRKKWKWFQLFAKQQQYTHTNAAPDFSGDVVRKMDNLLLLEKINQLPYKYREVIILRYLQEYAQDEVAHILQIPVGTVKSRISTALRKLRSKYNKTLHFFTEVEKRHGT
ncbi:sigma-70 family RNA polymerase sigma factor [Bacillus thuringiensis]|nr:sigma-70 family RNA polymerase sigma factor [Bacillus thuringiensis]